MPQRISEAPKGAPQVPLGMGGTVGHQRTLEASSKPRMHPLPGASGASEGPGGHRKHRGSTRVPPLGLGGLGASQRTPGAPRGPRRAHWASGVPEGTRGQREHRGGTGAPPLPWASGAPECSRGHQERRAVTARLVWPRGSRSAPEDYGNFEGAPEDPLGLGGTGGHQRAPGASRDPRRAPWASGAPEGPRGRRGHRGGAGGPPRSVPKDSGRSEGALQGPVGFGGRRGHRRTPGDSRGPRRAPWALGAPESPG